MKRTTPEFVPITFACSTLGCRREWIDYTVADGLVETLPLHPIDGEDVLVDLKGLRRLDESGFMLITELAAARYDCNRTWIAALIDQRKLKAYRQGLPGRRAFQLVKLRDVVVLMKERGYRRGRKRDGA